MSGHRCTGTVDTCNICSDRHAHKTGPLPSDIEAATRWAERDFERLAYGELRPGPAVADPIQERHLQQRREAVTAGLCPHGAATSPHDVTQYLPGGVRRVVTCTAPTAVTS